MQADQLITCRLPFISEPHGTHEIIIIIIRDVPDPVFYRIPDASEYQISPDTGQIIPEIFLYRIPDNTG